MKNSNNETETAKAHYEGRNVGLMVDEKNGWTNV